MFSAPKVCIYFNFENYFQLFWIFRKVVCWSKMATGVEELNFQHTQHLDFCLYQISLKLCMRLSLNSTCIYKCKVSLKFNTENSVVDMQSDLAILTRLSCQTALNLLNLNISFNKYVFSLKCIVAGNMWLINFESLLKLIRHFSIFQMTVGIQTLAFSEQLSVIRVNLVL